MPPQQQSPSSRLIRWILVLIPALALAAMPSPRLETPSPDVVLTEAYLTPAQFLYMEALYDSPYLAEASALSVNASGEMGVNSDPLYTENCESCAVFDKNQHGYKVTLPVGWTFSYRFGISDRTDVVELTYWDAFKNKPITLTAEMGTIHAPDSLSTISLDEVEPEQVMYTWSGYIRFTVKDGEGVAAFDPEMDVEFRYLPSETGSVPIVLTSDGFVACLEGERYWYDTDFVEEGERILIVDC